MSDYYVETTKIINAPSERVYGIIADYHKGHPKVLPSRYFSNLTVTDGGKGAGTRFKVEMNVFGAKALYDMTVTEPQPGRMLVEEDIKVGVVTTFTVEPVDENQKTQVTISTRAKTSPGFKGKVEKVLNPVIIRRIYRQEREQLSEVAKIINSDYPTISF
jgi:hypothetical protein